MTVTIVIPVVISLVYDPEVQPLLSSLLLPQLTIVLIMVLGAVLIKVEVIIMEEVTEGVDFTFPEEDKTEVDIDCEVEVLEVIVVAPDAECPDEELSVEELEEEPFSVSLVPSTSVEGLILGIVVDAEEFSIEDVFSKGIEKDERTKVVSRERDSVEIAELAGLSVE